VDAVLDDDLDCAARGLFVACDVLAEDYVLGRRVRPVLRKRVVMASGAVVNLVRGRDVAGFLDRYRRWAWRA
jgi:hypothetical protein